MTDTKTHPSKWPGRWFLPIMAAALLALGAPAFWADTRAATRPLQGRTYQFINGQWFDGEGFQRRIFYSADGVLTGSKPAKVDEVVDLKDGYVVPPFADAHTHHFDNPANIAQHLAMYLKDGVFYAKVQTDVRSRAQQVVGKVNRPEGVDVSYAHGGLSASNGHPLATYESLALYSRTAQGLDADQTKKLRASRLRDNDAYYIIDTAADLETKWPRILQGKPDFIKVYLLYSEEYEERRNRADTVGDRGLDPKWVPLIVEKAHAAGLRVSAHVGTASDYRVALNAGVDEMAHLPGSNIPQDIDPRRYQLTEEDVKETARRGVWVVPAPAYYEAFDPESPAFDATVKARTEAVRIRNLKLLQRYKVKIAFGSDSFGRSLLKDVLYLKTLGVYSNLEMLKIWCEDTPRTIFPNRKIGRLADGHEASFLVLDGDPLADFAQTRNIRLRFKQGYFVMARGIEPQSTTADSTLKCNAITSETGTRIDIHDDGTITGNKKAGFGSLFSRPAC